MSSDVVLVLLVLLGLVLSIVLIPVIIGIGVALLFHISGMLFYGIVILVAFIIWICMYILVYV